MKQLSDAQQQRKIVLEASLEHYLGLIEKGAIVTPRNKLYEITITYASEYESLTGEKYQHRYRGKR